MRLRASNLPGLIRYYVTYPQSSFGERQNFQSRGQQFNERGQQSVISNRMVGLRPGNAAAAGQSASPHLSAGGPIATWCAQKGQKSWKGLNGHGDD
jgi:hypothetical protein